MSERDEEDEDGVAAATLSTIDLLERVRSGDADALDRLYGRYRTPLQRWARGRLPVWARDIVDTEDIVQDTLLRTIPHVDEFDHRATGAFGAYLRHCVLNGIRDAVRRAGRRPGSSHVIEELAAGGPSPVEEAIGLENLERYEAALSRLNATDREAVTLRLELGLQYAQIAEHLGKPSPDAARMIVARAIARLARELAG